MCNYITLTILIYRYNFVLFVDYACLDVKFLTIVVGMGEP